MNKVDNAVKSLCQAIPEVTRLGAICEDINKADVERVRRYASNCRLDRLAFTLRQLGHHEGSLWTNIQNFVNMNIIPEKKQDEILSLNNQLQDAIEEEVASMLVENCSCLYKK